MKIRDKLLLTFISIALSFAALGYIEHRHISEVTGFFQEQETQRSSALTALLELSTATRRASVEAMGYAMHGEPEDKALVQQALDQIDQQLQHFLALKRDDSGKSVTDDLVARKESFIQVLNEYLMISESPTMEQILIGEERLHKSHNSLIRTIDGAMSQVSDQLEYDLLMIRNEARKVLVKVLEYSLRGHVKDREKAMEAVGALHTTQLNFVIDHSAAPEFAQSVVEQIASYISVAKDILQQLSSRRHTVGGRYIKAGELHAARKQLINTLKPLIDRQYIALRHTADDASTQLARAVRLHINNSHILVTVIAILAGVLLARSISTPLVRLSSLVNRFGHGEPIAPENIPVKGALELRQLGLAIADMIRERDALETSLKEREAFVRMLLDTSPVGLVLVRMDGTLVEINLAYARIIGRSVEETLSLTYWDFTPKEYRKQEQAQLKTLERSGRYGPYEKEYLHQNGHRVPVRLSGLMIERDGEQHIWSVVEDITEQRQAVTEINRQIQVLRMTEQRLAEAQRVAYIGSWELDLVENRLWWSDEVFRIFEVDPENFDASYGFFLDSVHPDDRDTVNRAYAESVANRKPYDMVHRLLFNDGRIKYINKRCKTIYDETGTALRSIGTVQDITDRHQQKLEKRRWYAMLNALVEGSSDAIFVKDRDSRYLIVNQALCDLLGQSKDEIIGVDDYALFPEKLAKQFRSDDRRIMEQAKTKTYEEPVITANETLTYLTTKGALVINDEIQGCFGIARDITPLKQFENALRHSEQRVKLLLNTLPHGIQENDIRGVITYSNIAHHRILGRKPGDLIGRYVWDSQTDSKHKQELRDYLGYLVEQQPLPQPYVTRNITGDGREVIVQVDWDYQRNTEGVVTGFVSVISDITERTRMEQQLKSSEAKYKAILEAQPDLMFQLSDDGVHLDFYAPSFDELYVDPKEFLGKRVDEVLPQEVSNKYRHYIRETLKTSHMQVFEYQLISPEGSRYYDCRMVVSGKNKTLANVREITKIKRAEAALRRLNQELEDRVHERTAKLEAANKELESFAYSVSHDLRTPLRAIDGFSLALAEDYGDQLNVVALDYLQRVRKGAQRMGLLIDDMLQLSRVNRGELRSQEVDLGEIAKTVLQEFRAAEPERRVELTLGRDMRVQGDSRLLRVMLDNLLGNAWKFTAREAVSQIIFEQKTDQPGTFYMSDNGVGFDMRHADKLFGAFQRLHRVTDFPGTGVGLATVQRIVNRHGGRVWGEAQEGKGATFYFCIESAGARQAKSLIQRGEMSDAAEDLTAGRG